MYKRVDVVQESKSKHASQRAPGIDESKMKKMVQKEGLEKKGMSRPAAKSERPPLGRGERKRRKREIEMREEET